MPKKCINQTTTNEVNKLSRMQDEIITIILLVLPIGLTMILLACAVKLDRKIQRILASEEAQGNFAENIL